MDIEILLTEFEEKIQVYDQARESLEEELGSEHPDVWYMKGRRDAVVSMWTELMKMV